MGETYRLVKAEALFGDAERGLSQRLSGALASVAAGTTLLVFGEEDRTVSRWFVSPSSGEKHRAFALARAVRARSEVAEAAPDLRGGFLSRLEWMSGRSEVAPSTSGLQSPQPLADALDEALLPGEWVAVSMRSPGPFERGRWRRWLQYHRGTAAIHHSTQPNALAVSVWASASSPTRAQELVAEIAAAMSPFDLVTPAVLVTKGSSRRAVTVGVAAAAAVTAALWVVPVVVPANAAVQVESMAAAVDPRLWGWLAVARMVITVAAAVAAGWWLLSLFGVVPDGWSRLQRALAEGRVPTPPTRRLRPRPARDASVKWVGDGESRRQEPVAARDGDYPLHHSTFLMGAELPGLFALPGAGVSSGSGVTRERNAPPALLQQLGPQIGEQSGTPVYLCRADMYAGLFAIGRPRSGKTALLEWLAAESMRDDSFTSLATIAFDTKGDSALAGQLSRWGAWAGRTVRVIRLADLQVMLALDIFGGGSVQQRAGRIIAALRYVEGSGVGPQTEETLRAILPIAMLVDPVAVAAAPGVSAGKSAIYYAHVLAGGYGDEAGRALFEAVAATCTRPEAEQAIQGAQVLFGAGVTPSARKNQSSSARNKLDSMVQVDHFWAAGELDGAPDWSVIFGGQGRQAKHVVFDFAGLEEQAREDVAKFLLFRLRQSIVEHCAGFEQQGRVVQVIADEVKSIAADAADVVSWFRSDGASFGVRALFATQRPRQLPDAVRTELLGFGTIVAFGQDDGSTASEIASQLSKESAPWSKDDIETLPQYTAAVYTLLRQQRQPAFTVQVPNFAARELGS